MREYIMLLFLLGAVVSSHAQNFCDSPPSYSTEDTLNIPWYGDNEMLYRILESYPEALIEPSAIRSGDGCDHINSALVIPVKFWVWRADENDNPVNASDLQTVLDAVNENFLANGLNFRLYQSCPADFLIDPDKVSFSSQGEFHDLDNGASLDDAINIHVVAENEDNPNWGGRYGNILNDFIGVRRDVINNPARWTTLIHELGHYFNLEHTHLNTDNPACCIREPVTREKAWHVPCIGCLELIGTWYDRRCSRTGDFLCDTPADPSFLSNFSVDQYQVPFSPDLTNHMSYYNSRSTFTNSQKAILLNNIFTRSNREFILEANAVLLAKPDSYEPDDTEAIGEPRLILLDELQCHTMHNAIVTGTNICADYRDWLRIENEQGMLGGYRLIIRDVAGYINPVEDIVIYNTANNGERTDAINVNVINSGSERIWEIPCGAMIPNTNPGNENEYNDFLVEIIRNEQLGAGFYRAKLERNIDKLPRMTDREQVCVGSIFKVTTLPFGATVTWSASNLTLSSSSGASTSITSVLLPPGSGVVYEIEALVELDGCTYLLSDTFTEVAASSLPAIESIAMDVEGNPCEPLFTFSTPQVAGGIFYDWTCSATVTNGTFFGCFGDVVNSSNGLAYTHASGFSDSGEDFIVNVTLTVGNDCGVEVTKSQGFLYRPENGCNIVRSVSITPNPVNTGVFTLEIIDETLNPDSYQIAILSQFGDVKYMINSTDKVHQINSQLLANGLYYAQVISNMDLVTTTFYVQH